MMTNVRQLRQVLKALGDDTRLRMVNILQYGELTVKDICGILGIKQPTASKHLVRLRLLRIVRDRRSGNRVHYALNPDSLQERTVKLILTKFKGLEGFKKDAARIGRSR
ncbi:ArsR/SmtB family transcription factor [Candidatus Omnitrophota bacterium]